jgi:hypothetical protein
MKNIILLAHYSLYCSTSGFQNFADEPIRITMQKGFYFKNLEHDNAYEYMTHNCNVYTCSMHAFIIISYHVTIKAVNECWNNK